VCALSFRSARTTGPSQPSALKTARERISQASIWCIFTGSLSYGLYRIRFGINLADEGFYLASPLRYALGDLPFRDEWANPLRMFDIVLAPVLYLVPDVSVYQLRFAWLVVQVTSALTLYMLLRRFAPDVVVALACTTTLWLPNIIWTPGYHVMSASFFVLAWVLWLFGCLSRAPRAAGALGSLGGSIFFLATLSYLPLLAVLIVPAAALAWALVSRRLPPGVIPSTAGFFAVFVFSLTAALLLCWHLHLLQGWVNAYMTIRSYPRYAAPLRRTFSAFLDQTTPYLPILLAVPALVLAMIGALRCRLVTRGTNQRTASLLLPPFAALLGGCVLGLFFRLPVRQTSEILLNFFWITQSLRIVVLALGLHLVPFFCALMRRFPDTHQEWDLVYLTFLPASLLFALTHGVLSTQAFKMMFAVVPLTALGVVAVYRLLVGSTQAADHRAGAALCMTTFCLALGIASFSARLQYNYQGPPLTALTKQFSHPLLSHIYSDPTQVAALDSTLHYLSGHVKRGDFLLAYDEIPLLYYLTQTRPAVDHSWSSKLIPLQVRTQSVAKMIQGGRIPRYAVRCIASPFGPYSTDPAQDPIHAFVSRNFTRQAAFPPFEVWALNTDPLHTSEGATPGAAFH
jgi:hypothetical protein